ncbi:hypothetical protein NE237_019181 [Protea cynaroides]|uniref:UVR domain-containing protein n=1 Tax=Protea cynaroides TaxID=273540 RepID=A0A9Q0QPP6_9MAGN|nr:hypothetical protein NE237_019181 [Protea cynaroides]
MRHALVPVVTATTTATNVRSNLTTAIPVATVGLAVPQERSMAGMNPIEIKDYKEATRIRDSLRSFEEEEPVLRLQRLMKEPIAVLQVFDKELIKDIALPPPKEKPSIHFAKGCFGLESWRGMK